MNFYIKGSELKIFINKITEYINYFIDLNNKIYKIDREVNYYNINYNKDKILILILINEISKYEKNLDLFSEELKEFFKRLIENKNINNEIIKKLESCFFKWIVKLKKFI